MVSRRLTGGLAVVSSETPPSPGDRLVVEALCGPLQLDVHLCRLMNPPRNETSHSNSPKTRRFTTMRFFQAMNLLDIGMIGLVLSVGILGALMTALSWCFPGRPGERQEADVEAEGFELQTFH